MPDDSTLDPAPVAGESAPAPGAPESDAAPVAAEAETELRKARREAQNLRARLREEETARQARERQDAEAAGQHKELAAQARAEVEQLKAELAARDRAALLAQIASKYHLPAELAERLRGDDEETLEADAKALAKLIPAPVPPTGAPTNPARAGRVSDLDQVDAWWQQRDKGRSKSGGFKL